MEHSSVWSERVEELMLELVWEIISFWRPSLISYTFLLLLHRFAQVSIARQSHLNQYPPRRWRRHFSLPRFQPSRTACSSFRHLAENHYTSQGPSLMLFSVTSMIYDRAFSGILKDLRLVRIGNILMPIFFETGFMTRCWLFRPPGMRGRPCCRRCRVKGDFGRGERYAGCAAMLRFKGPRTYKIREHDVTTTIRESNLKNIPITWAVWFWTIMTLLALEPSFLVWVGGRALVRSLPKNEEGDVCCQVELYCRLLKLPKGIWVLPFPKVCNFTYSNGHTSSCLKPRPSVFIPILRPCPALGETEYCLLDI